MADPVIPDYFRAQAIFTGDTGAGEDVFVNSFVFENTSGLGPADDPAEERVAVALKEFYSLNAPNGRSLVSYMPQSVITNTLKIKVYDLGDQPPRFPKEFSYPIVPSASGPLPTQIACCLSYYSGRSLPRNRGRIFLGPLIASTIATVANVGPRFDPAFLETVTQCAERLRNGNGQSVQWALLSQADSATKIINGGWVDDRPDIITGRAIDTKTRTLWGLPQAG